jgi:hypothetical protein
MPLSQKLEAYIKERKWREADQAADQLLAMMENKKAEPGKPDRQPIQERLPTKIQKIQKELPGWIYGDVEKEKKASGMMKTLDEQLKAMKFEQAEGTADSILKMIGQGDRP